MLEYTFEKTKDTSNTLLVAHEILADNNAENKEFAAPKPKSPVT